MSDKLVKLTEAQRQILCQCAEEEKGRSVYSGYLPIKKLLELGFVKRVSEGAWGNPRYKATEEGLAWLRAKNITVLPRKSQPV